MYGFPLTLISRNLQTFVDFQTRISSPCTCGEIAPLLIQNGTATDGPTMFDFGGVRTPLTPIQGVCEILSVLAMIMFAILSRRTEDKMAEDLDEEVQSTQDYAVQLRVKPTLCGSHNKLNMPTNPDDIVDFYKRWLPAHPVAKVTIIFDSAEEKTISRLLKSVKNLVLKQTVKRDKLVVSLKPKKETRAPARLKRTFSRKGRRRTPSRRIN